MQVLGGDELLILLLALAGALLLAVVLRQARKGKRPSPNTSEPRTSRPSAPPSPPGPISWQAQVQHEEPAQATHLIIEVAEQHADALRSKSEEFSAALVGAVLSSGQVFAFQGVPMLAAATKPQGPALVNAGTEVRIRTGPGPGALTCRHCGGALAAWEGPCEHCQAGTPVLLL